MRNPFDFELPPEKVPRRAAQYIRMSTDKQEYSSTNQAASIAAYAASRSLVIVRSYTDAARSGLTFEGRPALQQLIKDVQDQQRMGHRDFDVILVYDISRWGRFQDVDESAYYEYLCRSAGVEIDYCAELFSNDQSLPAALMKNLKRVMAGEYSRELSVKVFCGQATLAARGFHIGSPPRFGLRRWLIDQHGVRKMELKLGQRKYLQTDRTILVPGPRQEVETVRLIFDLMAEKKMTCRQIADTLNQERNLRPGNVLWYPNAVLSILRNEKYAGTNLFYRNTRKMGTKPRRTPPEQWIRAPNAFDSIVSLEKFRRAQLEIRSHIAPYENRPQLLLDYLTASWCRYGKLSATVIKAAHGPAATTYKEYFGGLTQAYARIGYRSEFIVNRPRNRLMCDAICREIMTKIAWYGATSKPLTDYRILVNDELVIGVLPGRTAPSNIQANQNKWCATITGKRRTDILVIARVDGNSIHPFDYFILPLIFLPLQSKMTISGQNYLQLDHFRSETLEPLYQICRRHQLGLIDAP
ncbi:MAG: recombinase family protein [Pseudolabrys sp.]